MSDVKKELKIDYIIKIGDEYFLKWEKGQLFTVRLRSEASKMDRGSCREIIKDLSREGFASEIEEYELHRTVRRPRKKSSGNRSTAY